LSSFGGGEVSYEGIAVFPLGVVLSLVKMLLIGTVLPGTQGECRREIQSKGDRYNMEQGCQDFLLLFSQLVRKMKKQFLRTCYNPAGKNGIGSCLKS
jgi:hypothetical protein